MSALALGLIAALCWGIHDITIRYLSRSVPLLAALLTVLLVGAVFQLGAILILGESIRVPMQALWLAIGAGISFLVASLGLYFAFERGPVRLVAPLIASYPILSVSFAVLLGAQITFAQIVAVLAIVVGVGIVAALSDGSDDDTPPIWPTIGLSLIAAAGFASTFKLGQLAALAGPELPTTMVARLTALVLLIIVVLLRGARSWPGRRALFPLFVMGTLDGVALMAVISAAPLPNPEYAAVASSTFGLLTILLAWLFLREKMSLSQWGGCILAFSGIAYLAL
ncbi:MAG: DMT family transporter [Dinoroseobacter sp.]|nr:DMT family transporter [Dinoroseobacter sp.]NQZ74066.1 DMT family transporter [Dinoroseobacter sp.]